MEDCYSPKKKKPRNTYFLGCFGFSFPVNNQELELSSSGHKVKDAGGKNRKQSSCFSFKRFKGKQSAARTVPVDSAADVATVKGGDEELKKGSVKRRQLLTEKVSVTGQTKHSDKSNKSKYKKQENIILEQGKSLDHSHHSNCHPNSSASPPPPKDKHEIITRAVSLPQKRKVLTTSSQPAPVKTAKLADREKDANNNIDSTIGMSILMVTLIIMVFWGKLCAIICTCAWFYFLPKIRAKNEAAINAEEKKIDDMDSMEYKKKVVLNGFLERNHRN